MIVCIVVIRGSKIGVQSCETTVASVERRVSTKTGGKGGAARGEIAGEEIAEWASEPDDRWLIVEAAAKYIAVSNPLGN
jgi:hypothetical protein